MAGGGGVTKEPGTDPFARRFHEAGFSVLALDYRRLGDSGGQPRQVLSISDQLAAWQATIGSAPALPGADPARLAIWGFSLSGGHVFRVAARNPQLAAAIAQTPNADGPAAARNVIRHQKPLATLRPVGKGILDAAGSLAGRQPLLVPLAGQPGYRRAPHHAGQHRPRQGAQPRQQVPRLAAGGRRPLRAPAVLYRPGRDASRVACPLLVVVCDQDQSGLVPRPRS
jgi:pimeloyl-ACP methyl ester carboxylesterase